MLLFVKKQKTTNKYAKILEIANLKHQKENKTTKKPKSAQKKTKLQKNNLLFPSRSQSLTTTLPTPDFTAKNSKISSSNFRLAILANKNII